jgi:hypothetical protein
MSDLVICKHGRNIEQEIPCSQCLEAGDRQVLVMSVGNHLAEAVRSFFYFQFTHCIVDLVWAVQKLTKTGEFGPKGYFSKYK